MYYSSTTGVFRARTPTESIRARIPLTVKTPRGAPAFQTNLPDSAIDTVDYPNKQRRALLPTHESNQLLLSSKQRNSEDVECCCAARNGMRAWLSHRENGAVDYSNGNNVVTALVL